MLEIDGDWNDVTIFFSNFKSVDLSKILNKTLSMLSDDVFDILIDFSHLRILNLSQILFSLRNDLSWISPSCSITLISICTLISKGNSSIILFWCSWLEIVRWIEILKDISPRSLWTVHHGEIVNLLLFHRGHNFIKVCLMSISGCDDLSDLKFCKSTWGEGVLGGWSI